MKKLLGILNVILIALVLCSFAQPKEIYQYYNEDGVLITSSVPPTTTMALDSNYHFAYDSGSGGSTGSKVSSTIIATATTQETYDNYVSFWAPWTSYTTDLNARRYDLHERYYTNIDLVVGEIETFSLSAGETRNATYTYSTTVSIEQTTAITNAYEVSIGVVNSIDTGLGIDLDLFEISEKVSNSIEQSTTFKTSISYSTSTTVSHTFSASHTETYTNPLEDKACIVKRCFRQTYKIYPCTEYEYVYSISESRSGLFNKDVLYTYTLDEIKKVQDYYILVPADSAYYSISYYSYDNNNNIYYIGSKTGDFIYV